MSDEIDHYDELAQKVRDERRRREAESKSSFAAPAESSELSKLRQAIEENIHECRKMSGSKDVAISAIGTHGLSMMEEIQRLLSEHEAQHNS